jgi:methyl-accepting chemotaxis protein
MYNWGSRRTTTDLNLERRARQVKEIVRLGTALRAEQGVENILAQLVNSINTTIGFTVAAFNLIRQESAVVEIAATAGINEADRQRLMRNPPPVDRLRAVMRDDFRISRSFFIPHVHKYLLEGVEGVTQYDPQYPDEQRPRDGWHTEDVLLVPLTSPRTGHLLGILSLDQPEDGKVPTQETIEIIELYGDQAALAIDTSLLFAEREAERRQLDIALGELTHALERVRSGDLSVRMRLGGHALAPMAEMFNAVLADVGDVLGDVREASDVVSHHATGVRAAAAQLVADAQYRAARIREVSREVGMMAGSVREIATTAHTASAMAREASDISHLGRQSAERAAEGMSNVREITLQSAKKIKRLSESIQEIGQIIQLVSDFASQTNLLALNAAIEAARAGEHGRGFAVVAHEIRNLASSSADAAKQIQGRIQQIQGETTQVMVIIDHSTQQVVMQSELAAEAGAALEEVDTATQRIAEAIGAINESATHQGRAAAGISEATAEIATMTEQTRSSMERMRGAMDELVELAGLLLNKISLFQVERRASTAGTLAMTGEVTGSLSPLRPPDVMEEATLPMPVPQASSPAWASLGATTPHSPLPLTPARPSQPLAGAAPRLVPVPSGPLPSGPLDARPSGPLIRSSATGPISPDVETKPGGQEPPAHDSHTDHDRRPGNQIPFHLPDDEA